MFHLELSRKAGKELEKIPSQQKEKITSKFIALENNPYLGKKLDGEYENCRSVYVWPYRIIYMILKDRLLVYVIKVGHRQGVYK
ncbi:MAG: type II toxin-antitoxin system RelE/ParE family toxin [Patescibacteria group bacterium]|jgi:mRNA interferase RelE/StbE